MNPRDPRAVALWAANLVYKNMEGPRTLWVRITLDGPGYMLTEPGKSPKTGIWHRIRQIDEEDAYQIEERSPRGWPALCRLAEAITEVTGFLPL